MTTYLLHGGITFDLQGHNREFYQTITSHIPENGSVLLIYFAKAPNRWDELFETEKKLLRKYREDINVILANPTTIEKQLYEADSIHIGGGNENKLMDALLPVQSQLTELFTNKIIAASSAGANILSTYYYSNDNQKVAKGYGFLPIKVICHYNDSKKEQVKLLTQVGNDLPIMRIPERSFITYTPTT